MKSAGFKSRKNDSRVKGAFWVAVPALAFRLAKNDRFVAS
jgi:hypothetical protein